MPREGHNAKLCCLHSCGAGLCAGPAASLQMDHLPVSGPRLLRCTLRMLASAPETPAVLPTMRVYDSHAATTRCPCRVRQKELSLRGNQHSCPHLQVEGGQHRAVPVQKGPVVERIPR